MSKQYTFGRNDAATVTVLTAPTGQATITNNLNVNGTLTVTGNQSTIGSLIVSGSASVATNLSCLGLLTANNFSVNTITTPSVFRNLISGTGLVTFTQSSGVINVASGNPTNIAIPNASGTGTTNVSASAGSANLVALSDHTHGFSTALPDSNALTSAVAEGTSASFARADHKHVGVRTLGGGTGDITISNTGGSLLSYASQVLNLRTPLTQEYYVFVEMQSQNVNPFVQTATAGTYVSRVLNTFLYGNDEYGNSASNISLSTSSTTNTGLLFKAGVYRVSARVPFVGAGNIRLRMYNSTTAAILGYYGAVHNSGTASTQSVSAYLDCIFQITTATTNLCYLQYVSTSSTTAASQMGTPTNISGVYELYTHCKVTKFL